MNHGTRARAFERMAALCTAGLDLLALFDASVQLLAEALPHDASCWHTMDPSSLIETGLFFEDMPEPGPDVFEFAYLSTDFNTFTGLMSGPRHSGVLSEATAGRLDRSPRYRELLRPNNIQGELRTAFVVDGVCWGCFALFRVTPADFTPAERDFAHDLATALGRGFRAAGLQGRSSAGAANQWPGLLLLDGEQQVESVTTSARTWLAELGFDGVPEHDPLPFAVFAVAERVRSSGAEAISRVLGTAGRWVQVQGAPATGAEPGRVAIILQAATSPSIATLIYAAHGFTARERELTELVLRGWDTAEIAAQLFISPHTVQGHLKSIFAKVGVRSRRELVGRVFGRYDQPSVG